jgi:hypothetical protein
MPEYLSPGVYVEEYEIGPRPIEGVGTSTAGFLGMTERGQLKPGFVTSYDEFERYYGGHIKGSFTAYAVEGFFNNGGQRCFIGRVVKGNPKENIATLSLDGGVSMKAVGPGAWGSRVAIRVEGATSKDPNKFKMIVAYWSSGSSLQQDDGTLNLAVQGDTDEQKNKSLNSMLAVSSHQEVYDELSMDESSGDHYMKRINGKSFLIEMNEPADGITAPPPTADGTFGTPMAGGVDPDGDLTRENMKGDPSAKPGERVGLVAFEEVDEIAILYAPDVNKLPDMTSQQAFVDDLLTHCETLKDRFCILDIPEGSSDINALSISSPPLRPSLYGAVYYPWIKVLDPLTKRQKLVPPGGYMAGIYARSDNERGVHKAPANELVRGALDLEFPITKGEQDLLNPRNINCIRFFQGRGILVWGGRTISDNSLWKYINVRRLFIYIEESIEEGTQWVVFEPNDEKLGQSYSDYQAVS